MTRAARLLRVRSPQTSDPRCQFRCKFSRGASENARGDLILGPHWKLAGTVDYSAFDVRSKVKAFSSPAFTSPRNVVSGCSGLGRVAVARLKAHDGVLSPTKWEASTSTRWGPGFSAEFELARGDRRASGLPPPSGVKVMEPSGIGLPSNVTTPETRTLPSPAPQPRIATCNMKNASAPRTFCQN